MAFTEGAPAATPSTLTNGAPAGRGLVNYRFLPGTWRGAANDDNRKLWMAYGPAKTDLQAHATCLGAAWDTPDEHPRLAGRPVLQLHPVAEDERRHR